MDQLFTTNENIDLSQIIHTLGDAVGLTDGKMTFLGVNKRFAELYDAKPEDLVGINAFEVYPHFKTSVFYEGFEHTIKTGEPASRVGYSNKLKTWILSRSAKYGEDRYIAVSQVLRSGFNKVGFVSNFDSLTSLQNRHGLECDLELFMKNRIAFGLFIIDLKKFRYINEAYGSEFGDLCLMETAARVKGNTPSEAQVYRIQADQFLVVVPGSKEVGMDVIHKITNAFKKPFIINSNEHVFPIKVGFYHAANPLETVTEVINNVDGALQEAKRGSYNFCEFNDQIVNHRARVVMSQELKKALKDGQFNIYYQAQVDCLSTKICGVEALIRWQHPTRGLLTPGAFLDTAIEFDLVEDIDRLVIFNVFNEIKNLLSQKFNIPVSINLSAQSISNPTIVEYIDACLERTKCNPKCVVFEVTETSLADDTISSKVIKELQKRKFKIALDDFGTGYSSFRYLVQYPSDYLKIDRSFITNLDKNQNLQTIVHNIIRISHSLGIMVIAEGAERNEEVQVLKEFDCDMIQGYIYAKPESKEDLFKRLHAKGVSTLKSSID